MIPRLCIRLPAADVMLILKLTSEETWEQEHAALTASVMEHIWAKGKHSHSYKKYSIVHTNIILPPQNYTSHHSYMLILLAKIYHFAISNLPNLEYNWISICCRCIYNIPTQIYIYIYTWHCISKQNYRNKNARQYMTNWSLQIQITGLDNSLRLFFFPKKW